MRYYTTERKKAFQAIEHLNFFEAPDSPKKWRVGARVTDHIVFDLDSHDENNLKTIVMYYTKLFGKLRTFKTNGGYHIYSDKIEDIKYNHCRVLYPLLERDQTTRYIIEVKSWIRGQKINRREDFADHVQNEFPKSGLFCGIGVFDIYFAMLPLIRGYYIVRISKKKEDEQVMEVLI